MIIVKDFTQLNADSTARLINLGYGDAQYVGTPVRNVLEAVDLHIAELYTDLASGMSGQYLSQAIGATLDALGLLVGCIRQIGEIDSNFRLRISQALTVSKTANLTALLSGLLTLSDVRNVVVVPYLYGIGSTGFYLIGTQGIVPQSTLSLAQNILNQYQAAGANSQALAPISNSINMNVLISASSPNQSSIAQGAIVSYLANLSMGSALIIDKIITSAINSSASITDVQILSLSITNLSETTELLLTDYTPAYNVQLIPGNIVVTGP